MRLHPCYTVILAIALLPADLFAGACDSEKNHIRWLIRRDMAEMLSVSNNSLINPVREGEFLQSLRQRNVIGMVAEQPLTHGSRTRRALQRDYAFEVRENAFNSRHNALKEDQKKMG